tara:strand:+ start:555 stop:701 length:147 start_codon:yes stop_codon:yes gene_type:complete
MMLYFLLGKNRKFCEIPSYSRKFQEIPGNSLRREGNRTEGNRREVKGV